MKAFRTAALAAALTGVMTAAHAADEQGVHPHPHQPPQAAFQACDGLAENEKVDFSTQSGEFHGICRVFDGRLAAFPAQGMRRLEREDQGDGRNSSTGPRPEAPRT